MQRAIWVRQKARSLNSILTCVSILKSNINILITNVLNYFVRSSEVETSFLRLLDCARSDNLSKFQGFDN